MRFWFKYQKIIIPSVLLLVLVCVLIGPGFFQSVDVETDMSEFRDPSLVEAEKEEVEYKQPSTDDNIQVVNHLTMTNVFKEEPLKQLAATMTDAAVAITAMKAIENIKSNAFVDVSFELNGKKFEIQIGKNE